MGTADMYKGIAAIGLGQFKISHSMHKINGFKISTE